MEIEKGEDNFFREDKPQKKGLCGQAPYIDE
jgi:hypothetical protein